MAREPTRYPGAYTAFSNSRGLLAGRSGRCHLISLCDVITSIKVIIDSWAVNFNLFKMEVLPVKELDPQETADHRRIHFVDLLSPLQIDSPPSRRLEIWCKNCMRV